MEAEGAVRLAVADPNDRPDDGASQPAHVTVAETRDVAFGGLYRREYVPMCRLAFLLLGGHGPVEEVVHDAFITVYERWDKADNHGAYLRSAVVSRCSNARRRWLLERRRTADGTTERMLASSVPRGVDAADLDLVEALRSIPAKRRAALVLRFYADLTEADIAATLGVAPGTVKSLISRGLTDLRKVVER